MKLLFSFLFFTLCLNVPGSAQDNAPVKIAVVGLTHSHVHWILGREDKGDISMVGVVEPNKDLAERFLGQHGLSMDLWYPDMESLFAVTLPDGVTAFGSIYEHLEVVQVCAPKGIHVMVEKPLAISTEHAKEMQALAERYGIHLLTNYETTWYSTNHKVFEQIHGENPIGPLRRVVINDGHEGPKEIGVNKEFLDWLTDPAQNGGGAVIDFGCYGANLMTWLMKGERPLSVTAELKQIKPEIYPEVDDDATLLLQYPETKGVIQASWNWPFSRKDMEVYGATGYLIAKNNLEFASRLAGDKEETTEILEKRPYPYDDPFSFFAAVINEEINVEPFDLSSLENNMIVVEILEAAIQSAESGERVMLE
ncbi:Gfo/Idh/MocA family protein [Pleomorphovibrio marinus]|uniref:Gfo/Idh/MocA family protein n=1 Tax=Pleomorphovibrio marinus TaxID=2164132 RepID=UPI000E0B5424|nr:Gfo/Idh/MocA family oxidoreductase [Pleomorphovibrio marinus]